MFHLHTCQHWLIVQGKPINTLVTIFSSKCLMCASKSVDGLAN